MCRKILTVGAEPLVISECWTYYKLSIIQTLSNFDEWLACHMKIFVDDSGFSLFGQEGSIYPLSYYADILFIQEADIFSISHEKIVNFLIEQIDNGKYIILDINYQKLYDEKSSLFWLHETLIYGYDKKNQEFITTILLNGKFKEYKVKFDTIKDAYLDAVKYYKSHINGRFKRRSCFFGITLLQPNNRYCNDNAKFDLITKLKFELAGNSCSCKECGQSDVQKTYTYHTGLACLNFFSEQFKRICDSGCFNETDKEKYRVSFFKLLEYQRLLLRSAKWFSKGIENREIIKIISKYEKCCDDLSINVMLYYKYIYSNNIDVLRRISNNLDVLLQDEKNVLKRMITLFTDEYIHQLYNIN